MSRKEVLGSRYIRCNEEEEEVGVRIKGEVYKCLG